MELDKFISESIKGIIKGISDAKTTAIENDVIINPFNISTVDFSKIAFLKAKPEGAHRIYQIDFDIAVTTTSTQNSGISGGINVLSLKMGGDLKDSDSNESASRIKFSLEMTLPKTDN